MVIASAMSEGEPHPGKQESGNNGKANEGS